MSGVSSCDPCCCGLSILGAFLLVGFMNKKVETGLQLSSIKPIKLAGIDHEALAIRIERFIEDNFHQRIFSGIIPMDIVLRAWNGNHISQHLKEKYSNLGIAYDPAKGFQYQLQVNEAQLKYLEALAKNN